MSDTVDIVVQGRTLISKSHPHRAAQETLPGYFACYEGPVWVLGQGQRYAERVGLTDEEGAKQFLRGEKPHLMYAVEEPADTPAVVPGKEPL